MSFKNIFVKLNTTDEAGSLPIPLSAQITYANCTYYFHLKSCGIDTKFSFDTVISLVNNNNKKIKKAVVILFEQMKK